MRYLILLFASPLALFSAKAPNQAIVNLVIYVLAWIDLFYFFVPGFTAWGIGVLHALVVINSRKSGRRPKRETGKQPLFEKSGAKTFAPLGPGQRNQHGPNKQSFFASFCSQKEAFFFANR